MNGNGNKADMVEVIIHGNKYQLKVSEDNSTYIQKVADYVDDIIRKIARETSINSTARLAILAALNITDELFSTIEERDKVLKTFEEKASSLSKSLSNINTRSPS